MEVLIMAKVDRNVADMRVPDYAYTDRYDGRVFIFEIEKDGTKHKRTLGHMTDSTPGQERMIPSRYFRDHFQNEYKEAYPDSKVPPHELSIGMYALTLGISERIGLYDVLKGSYGPQHANNLLDYAMFSILYRCSTTQLFEHTMARQVLFCDKYHTDNWYSDFFSKKLDEDLHHQFRIHWIEQLIRNGLKNVWLSIDGSNNDCEARQSFLAKYGFPKSHHTSKTIVGYMYVVDADTGRPVTYDVYEGNVPDRQAIQKIAVFLGSFGIKIEGVILDRGFAADPVIDIIESYGWKYVIMLPGDTFGHEQIMAEYSETIRWKSEYALEEDTLFARTDRKQLFKSYDRISDISLYFNGVSGSVQSVRLMRRIQTEKARLRSLIAKGKGSTVAKDLQRFLTLEGEGPSQKVVTHYAQWDASMSSKGFFSIATSSDIDADEADRLYALRDASETQFGILKSLEGADTTRVHNTEGIYSKFAVAFIASVIRFEIQYACKRLGLDTAPMIQGLERIVLLHTADEKYMQVRNLSQDQRRLMGVFHMDQDYIGRLARDYNYRNRRDAKNPVRTLPDESTPLLKENSHRKGRKPSEDKESTAVSVTSAEKSKGGRPKGKKDSKPRKPRSDKGKKRGPHAKK